MPLADVLKQPTLHIRVWEEDGWFIAQCLDIPGVVTQGKTREEALSNVKEAVSLALEVIAEDHRSTREEVPTFETLERPLEDFLPIR